MKRTIIAVGIGAAAFALVGVAIYAAQQTGSGERTWSRTFTVSNSGGERAWLGVVLTDVTADKARELKLSRETGALVTEVEPDSPAAKAGLEANDVILEFDGERVRSVAEMRRLIRDTPPDRTVPINVSRGGEMRNFRVKVGAAPFERVAPTVTIPEIHVPEIHMPNFNFEFTTSPRLGISAEELTPQLAQYFGVPEGKGVLVEEVEPGSAAEKAGLKAGDCIVRVGDAKVESVEDLHRALREKSGANREVNLTIVRDRREQTVKAQLEAPPLRALPRSIARARFAPVNSAELARLRAKLMANAAALRASRLTLERQTHGLAEQRQMLEELRRALRKQTREQNISFVD